MIWKHVVCMRVYICLTLHVCNFPLHICFNRIKKKGREWGGEEDLFTPFLTTLTRFVAIIIPGRMRYKARGQMQTRRRCKRDDKARGRKQWQGQRPDREVEQLKECRGAIDHICCLTWNCHSPCFHDIVGFFQLSGGAACGLAPKVLTRPNSCLSGSRPVLQAIS